MNNRHPHLGFSYCTTLVVAVDSQAIYGVGNIHNPSLTVFLPPVEKATGAAVVVAAPPTQ